jgi:CRISPR-associated protein Csd1
MILSRLYELAVREHLLDDLAFELMPIPFVVQVSEEGEYLGIEDRRATVTIESKRKGAPPRTQRSRGKELAVPRPHGNVNSQGFARLFADTLPRILPVTDDEKSARSRATFWEQIAVATAETKDPALQAVQRFGERIQSDQALAQRLRSEVEKLSPGVSDRCTLAWGPDKGPTIVERAPLRAWFARFLQEVTATRKEKGPRGVCQITGEVGPLPTTHSIKISGIPGGLPAGVSVVSFDKAAFESYGLSKAANAGIGYLASDGYLRALTGLIGGRLKDAPRTSMKIGKVLFLFWTREAADTSFMNLLDMKDPAQAEHQISSLFAGKESHAMADTNDFYLLGLSGNSARAIIRDYLEAPLSRIKENLKRWFNDLRIADLSKEGAGKPTNRFPLWLLSASTALEADRISPEIPSRLMEAALKGDELPASILAACLGRLRAEGRKGFRAFRLALIKLTLLRRNHAVTDTLNEAETHPAYVCGRLLAIFEQIQYTALGDVNASVVDKFFGTFSVAPAMVLGRLYAGAQNHLRKMRGDKPGAHFALEKLLSEVSDQLSAPPRGQLSLEDQGRFALGYYHQKARQFEQIAERKAAKAELAAAKADQTIPK